MYIHTFISQRLLYIWVSSNSDLRVVLWLFWVGVLLGVFYSLIYRKCWDTMCICTYSWDINVYMYILRADEGFNKLKPSTHSCIETYTHTYIHVCTHIYTCIETYTHTYYLCILTYIYIYTQQLIHVAKYSHI